LEVRLTILTLTLWIALGSFGAGFLGALTGLGGGVIIVPMLVLLFNIDLHYAIGASLVSVIATSSGAASSYVREGFANLRLGMLLEVATTAGAVVGATLVALALVPKQALAVAFGVVLLVSAVVAFRRRAPAPGTDQPNRLATHLRLNGSFPTPEGQRPYFVHRVPAGFGLMFLAGTLSGLLGIGSGALKVLAMDQAMRIPFKVSTTTSNFMIGVTAAASAGVYLRQGYIDPGLAMPILLGVLFGSFLGARVLAVAPSGILRLVFAIVLMVLGMQMIVKGLWGGAM
jgi:uncharacterized membrane protein YfcA